MSEYRYWGGAVLCPRKALSHISESMCMNIYNADACGSCGNYQKVLKEHEEDAIDERLRRAERKALAPDNRKRRREVNDFMIYVNGILMPTDMFDCQAANVAVGGKMMKLTVPEKEFLEELERMGGKVKRIDVIEVRASKTTKRYMFTPSEDNKNFKRLAENEETKTPKRMQFTCTGLSNSF